MKSKVGFILTLISGIITLVFGVFIMLLVVFLLLGSSQIEQILIDENLGEYMGNINLVIVIVSFASTIVVFIGSLKLYAARLMNNADTTVTGGIWAIVLGAITSDVLTLVGGIFGVVQGGKQEEKKAASITGYNLRSAGVIYRFLPDDRRHKEYLPLNFNSH